MGSPTIFSGRYTKLLTSKGILNSDGSINQFDGSKNYIPYAQFEQNVTTGWSLFNTTLTSGLPTGTVGAGAASLALTTTSTNPLSGSYSLQVAAGTAWTAGQGVISNAFTVDRADLGKVLTFSISYEATVGGSVANWSGILGSQTLAVYLYDVTASAWVQPAGFLGMNQNSGAGRVTGTFQTSVTSGQQYQLAIVALQATASPVTITLDQISCGPLTAPLGAAVTDFNNNLTLTPSAAFGTTTNQKYTTRRVGDSLEVIASFTIGTPAASAMSLQLPSGYSVDSSKLTSTTAVTMLGIWSAETSGVSVNIFNGTSVASGVIFYDGTTTNQVFFGAAGATSTYVKSIGTALPTSNCVVSCKFTVPIIGWSSNVQMSNDTDTRVVDFSGTKSSTQAVTGAATDITFTTSKDSHGAWNGSQYIVPVSGDYIVSIAIGDAGSTTWLASAYVDGVVSRALGESYAGGWASGSTIIPNLKAGQSISIRVSSSTTIQAVSYQNLSISRISGPSVIAATESVNARYTDVSGQAIGTSAAVFKFGTKDFDSHLAYSSSTGLYTCPVSGKYKVDARLFTAAVTLTTASGALLAAYKNGVFYSYIGKIVGTGVSIVVSYGGSDIVNCVAGDTLAVWAQSDVATTGSTTAGANHVTFERVGN